MTAILSRTHYLRDAANDVWAEVDRASELWKPFNSTHEGYAVLLEEVEELWDAIQLHELRHSIQEAVQVGAMAVRYVAEMRMKLDEVDGEL